MKSLETRLKAGRRILKANKKWARRPRGPRDKTTYVHELVDLYFKSETFINLNARTRYDYERIAKYYENLILYTGRSLYYMKSNNVDLNVVEYLINVMSHHLAAGTVQRYKCVMSNIFQYGVKKGYIWHNPFEGTTVKVSNERDVTWTREEVAKAIAKSKELGYHVLASYILICYETALRPFTDVRNLKWENIKQLEDGTSCVDVISSKTKIRLMIPISTELKEGLDALERVSDFILVDNRGLLYTKSAVWVQLRTVLKEANINQNLQFRDLRRTAITELAEGGATETELRAIGGWASAQMIKRYARIRYMSGKTAMNKRWAMRNENKAICGELKPIPGPA